MECILSSVAFSCDEIAKEYELDNTYYKLVETTVGEWVEKDGEMEIEEHSENIKRLCIKLDTLEDLKNLIDRTQCSLVLSIDYSTDMLALRFYDDYME